MPKRKLSDLDPPTSTKQSSIQATRLTQLFDQGVHNLSRALKTARGFERQKLSKREQKAKKEKNEAGLERIREEIGVLKTLEYTSIAERYIFKQLLKTKRIAESGPFNEFRQIKNIAPAGSGSTAEANVTARMFKSKPVQGVLQGVMAGVRKLLRIEDHPRGEEGVKEKEKKKEKVDEGTKKGQSKRDEEDLEEADDDNESMDYSHFDARLASGSGSDSGESDNEEGHEKKEEVSDSETGGVNLPKSQSQQSISRSPTRSASASPPPKKPKSSSTKTNPLKPTTTTTFLPSLAMGGYFSGSESEPEDIESGAPQRKNRMGQQARRALWEKKYGAKANHVKKAKKEEKTSRDSGWDLKRGATDGSERRPKKGKGYTTGPRSGTDSNMGMGRKEAKPKPQDDKPLHPSWEAAKKAKEQKATTAFQGKKVVFD